MWVNSKNAKNLPETQRASKEGTMKNATDFLDNSEKFGYFKKLYIFLIRSIFVTEIVLWLFY